MPRERTPEEQAEWDALPPVPARAYDPLTEEEEQEDDDFAAIFIANLNENTREKPEGE